MYIVSIAKDTQAYLIVEKKIMLHVNLLLQKAKKKTSETLKNLFMFHGIYIKLSI